MTAGQIATLWTIRLALALYAAFLAGELALANWPRWPKIGRWIWTGGCVVFLIHVACAFGAYYQWSFTVAYEQTAQATERIVGTSFGGGVAFNYLFTLLWVGDVLWWWLSPATHQRRPIWYGIALHGFFLFMAFNGAIVFHTGIVRWGGIAAFTLLAFLLGKRLLEAFIPKEKGRRLFTTDRTD